MFGRWGENKAITLFLGNVLRMCEAICDVTQTQATMGPMALLLMVFLRPVTWFVSDSQLHDYFCAGQAEQCQLLAQDRPPS